MATIFEKIKEYYFLNQRPRKIGEYRSSEIYDIVSGKLNAQNFFNKPERKDTEIEKMTIGEAHHLYLGKILKDDYDIEKEAEIEIEPGIKIVGRIDAIKKNPDKFFELTEIRTAKPLNIENIIKPGSIITGKIINVSENKDIIKKTPVLNEIIEFKTTRHLNIKEPYLNHLYQLECYLRMTEAKFGWIVYIQRGAWRSKNFKVERNANRWTQIVNAVLNLHQQLCEKKK